MERDTKKIFEDITIESTLTPDQDRQIRELLLMDIFSKVNQI